MNAKKPHVSIIILNWNGAHDTIECLETVLKSDYPRFNAIVVDNNSQDSSIQTIKSWAAGHERVATSLFPDLVLPLVSKPVPIRSFVAIGEKQFPTGVKQQLSSELPLESVVLVENQENVGFAAGNNLGIELGKAVFNSKYFFILNNDTVIDRDALTRLIEVLEAKINIGAATSAIYFYSNREEIANIGGSISMIATRKYFTKKTREKVKPITFATGCALLVRRDVFDKFGLLSTNFFFGEEDFEFCWRLRKHSVPVVCVIDSRVYHKIGISAGKLPHTEMQKKFIYFFNRIIDMKLNVATPLWQIWRFLLLCLIFIWLTVKYRTSPHAALTFTRNLRCYTNLCSDAKKETLDKLLEQLPFS